MAELPPGFRVVGNAAQPATPALDRLYGPDFAERRANVREATGGGYGYTDNLIGLVADDIEGYVSALGDRFYGAVTGTPGSFSEYRDERIGLARDDQKQWREEHPVADIATSVLGAAAVAPVRGVQAATSLGGRVLNYLTGATDDAVSLGARIQQGAAAGATGGGVGGFAEGEGGLAGRAETAAVGAGLGAALGMALPIAGEVTGRIAKGIRNIRGLQGEGARIKAEEMLLEALRRDGITPERLSEIAASGKPLTVADLGENTRELIGSAHRMGGEEGKALGKFLTERSTGEFQRGIPAGGQFARLDQDLQRATGRPATDFARTGKEIATERAARADAGYGQAYAQPAPALSENAQSLLETPAGKEAVREARRFMANRRRPVTDENENYTVEMLDQIQRALRDQAEKAGGQRATERAGNVKNLRGKFLDELPPDLRRTMSDYRSDSDMLNALEQGRQFMRGDVEGLVDNVANMTEGEADLFRLGVARELREKLGRTVDTGDASRLFANPNMRERLEVVFPDREQFETFMDAVRLERTMQESLNSIVRGSQTAARQVADQSAAGDAFEGLAEDMVAGGGSFGLSTIGRMAVNLARQAKDRTIRGTNEAVMGNIARMATRTDPDVVAQRATVRAGTPIRSNTQLGRVVDTLPAPATALGRTYGQAPFATGAAAGAVTARPGENPVPYEAVRPQPQVPEGFRVVPQAAPQQAPVPGPRAEFSQLQPAHAGVDLSNLDRRVADKTKQLQGALGMVLPVTSAYRDPKKNQSVGGAKNSQHLHGKAVDIDVSAMPQEQRLKIIEEASRLGFTGIGVYDNAIHLDLGGRRAWGPSYKFQSVPAWAKPTIQAHMRGKFRS